MACFPEGRGVSSHVLFFQIESISSCMASLQLGSSLAYLNVMAAISGSAGVAFRCGAEAGSLETVWRRQMSW